MVCALLWFLARSWLAPDPLEVRVVAADRGLVEATVTNSKAGTVKARQRAGISPEIGGRVVAVEFRPGDRVRAGDVLFRIADASYRAELELARKALLVAEAQYQRSCIEADLALRELDRNRPLAEQEIISADVLDRLESAFESATASCTAAAAEIERARAAVAVAEAELEKTAVRAPFDGVVAEMDVEVGEWITPSPPLLPVPPAIDLINLDSLYVSAPMDEVDSARIRCGMAAKISVDSHQGIKFAGRTVRVAPYVLDVEAQNRTVEVEAEFDDRALAAALLPGTSADLEIVLEAHPAVVRIPATALYEGGKVLVLEDGVLVERPVRVGIRNWDWCEVLDGLAPGDEVVQTLDRKEIRPGARARVAAPAP